MSIEVSTVTADSPEHSTVTILDESPVVVAEEENVKMSGCDCKKVLFSSVGLLFLLAAYNFLGAAIFEQIEGGHEKEEKAQIVKLREDIISDLWNSSHDPRKQKVKWMAEVRQELKKYEEQLHEAFLHGVNSDSEEEVWDFWGSFMYAATIHTTIGYGHIAPATDLGRIVTMIYATIGIPLCLIVLNNLGKLFTRGLKFLWSFPRRCFYTGQCTKGGQSEYTIDDEFNLPPIIAIVVAVAYMLIGALIYTQWEDWSYLEAFYFIFVSFSTIGFGDVLPEHPKYFLASSIFILIGLSLISMVLTVILESMEGHINESGKAITKGIGLDMENEGEAAAGSEKKEK